MIRLRIPKPTRKNFLPTIAGAAFVFVFLTAGGFAFAANQEQNDSFCASCHTQPESTYYQRSTAGEAVDLASAHRQEKTNCIDCHSGTGLAGRVSAEIMGASNAARWYTGTARQPAPLEFPIPNDNCLKCHSEVFTETHDSNSRTVNFGPKGHYHTFLKQWEQADPKASACTACHFGHETDSTADLSWVVTAAVQKECDSCHALMAN